jgi:hypothetical protein
MAITFTAPMWLYSGEASWHFVTLPLDVADEIEKTASGPKRGFGSVRVAVSVGKTTWETSLFPDSKEGSYVLPIKKLVREREGLVDGDELIVEITLLDL